MGDIWERKMKIRKWKRLPKQQCTDASGDIKVDVNCAVAISRMLAALNKNWWCWWGSNMLQRTGGGGNDAKLAFRGYGVCREGRARWELDAECCDRGDFQEDGGMML
jgi:hypothetical protein